MNTMKLSNKRKSSEVEKKTNKRFKGILSKEGGGSGNNELSEEIKHCLIRLLSDGYISDNQISMTAFNLCKELRGIFRRRTKSHSSKEMIDFIDKHGDAYLEAVRMKILIGMSKSNELLQFDDEFASQVLEINPSAIFGMKSNNFEKIKDGLMFDSKKICKLNIEQIAKLDVPFILDVLHFKEGNANETFVDALPFDIKDNFEIMEKIIHSAAYLMPKLPSIYKMKDLVASIIDKSPLMYHCFIPTIFLEDYNFVRDRLKFGSWKLRDMRYRFRRDIDLINAAASANTDVTILSGIPMTLMRFGRLSQKYVESLKSKNSSNENAPKFIMESVKSELDDCSAILSNENCNSINYDSVRRATKQLILTLLQKNRCICVCGNKTPYHGTSASSELPIVFPVATRLNARVCIEYNTFIQKMGNANQSMISSGFKCDNIFEEKLFEDMEIQFMKFFGWKITRDLKSLIDIKFKFK